MSDHGKNYEVAFFIYLELLDSSVIREGIEAHISEEFHVNK